MIMENLIDRYEIIDGNRLVFNSKASASDVQQILDTWKEKENTTGISIIDMSNCNITELRHPDYWPKGTMSLISRNFENLVEFIPPRILEKIGEDYFADCKKLRTVRFDSSSNSMTEIGENAFLHCDSIVEISLPKSLKKIGDGAFKSCNSIEFMELPANIEEIGEDSFALLNKMIWLDLSQCVNIKDLKIKVWAKQVYLPVNLETLECSGRIEDLWIPPTLKKIHYKTIGRSNIWCFSNLLTSLKQIEGLCTLCVPHSLAEKFQRIVNAERSTVKIFDFGEDGHKTQDYFWI